MPLRIQRSVFGSSGSHNEIRLHMSKMESDYKGLMRTAVNRRLWGEPAAVADHQGRRPISAQTSGAGSALHFGLAWTGHGSAALGIRLAARGGKNAKKRAVVAVARKLSVLLHRLWVTGERYEPLRHARAAPSSPVAA
ncbi:MAG: transposase family protein [Bryobacterales bacterium]|jgi:hypothetical protein|nr:transposase family protein [Bryobacterales bacterium]